MRVVWTTPALADLDEIQDFIAEDSPSSAYRVTAALYSRPQDALSVNPMIGRQGRAYGTREFVFADLPYVVVYRVTDQVEVLAVMHTARDWPEHFGDN